MRPQMLSKFGNKIELRMANPVETETGHRDVAKQVPEQPGRGVQRNGKHMLVGVPAAEGVDPSNQVPATAAVINEVWRGAGVPAAPPLRMLPAEVAYRELASVGADQLALGVGELEMETVAVDLKVTPHFYAVGRSKSGRSSVLRTLCRSIENTYRPEEAQVVVVDPNYQLVDAIASEYVIAYLTTVNEVAGAAQALAQKAQERRPPAGTPPQELAKWRATGPRWFVVVDDLNVLTPPGTSQSALFPLIPGIEAAHQLKLHVFAALQGDRWHATGAMNRVVHAMNAVGPAVLIMDGDKSEKIFDGVRAGTRVPGRGELVARNRPHELVQVALPPTAGEL